MRILLGSLVAAIGAVAALNLNGGAQTLQDVPLATGASTTPIVAELFTSQSCSSCPPAERLFSDLAERQDLIVLEWHVDYWDKLVHGRAGAWKDPYSDPAYTKRQRDYNRALRGTGSVYTPQAVINGSTETVGNQPSEVSARLRPAKHATTALTVEPAGDRTHVHVADYIRPLTRGTDIIQLTLLPGQTTSIPRGENRGATLSSRNLVLEAKTVGRYYGTATSVSIQPPANGKTCAIIVQERSGNQLGPILGASYCN